MAKLGLVTHMGRSLFLDGQSRLSSQGASAPQFCGFSASYGYTIRLGTTKFRVIAHTGRGVLGGQQCHYICTNATEKLVNVSDKGVPRIFHWDHDRRADGRERGSALMRGSNPLPTT